MGTEELIERAEKLLQEVSDIEGLLGDIIKNHDINQLEADPEVELYMRPARAREIIETGMELVDFLRDVKPVVYDRLSQPQQEAIDFGLLMVNDGGGCFLGLRGDGQGRMPDQIVVHDDMTAHHFPPRVKWYGRILRYIVDTLKDMHKREVTMRKQILNITKKKGARAGISINDISPDLWELILEKLKDVRIDSAVLNRIDRGMVRKTPKKKSKKKSKKKPKKTQKKPKKKSKKV